MVRMKPGQGPQWQAQQLSFSNSVLANNDDDKPFGEVLRRSIKSRQEDAVIFHANTFFLKVSLFCFLV